MLTWLKKDRSLMGLQNRAIILTLLTTGLRAQELCNLQSKDLEVDTDTEMMYVNGIGKGEKPFRQEIHANAVYAIGEAFKAKFKRDPRPSEYLLHSNGTGRLQKGIMWIRLSEIGKALKSAGVIRSDVEFSAHLFRRTYLTVLSKAGMSLGSLQSCARHSNVSTTFNHYVDSQESTKPYLDKALFGTKEKAK